MWDDEWDEDDWDDEEDDDEDEDDEEDYNEQNDDDETEGKSKEELEERLNEIEEEKEKNRREFEEYINSPEAHENELAGKGKPNKKTGESSDKKTDGFLKKAQQLAKESKVVKAALAVKELKDAAKKLKKIKKMRQEAKSIGCLAFVVQECPRCHESSLFAEPFLKKTFLMSISKFVGINRKEHWFCFNPQCKSYYMRTGDYFVNMEGMFMPKKNFFFVSKK